MRRIYHFQSQTKLQSAEWNHTRSSRQLPQYGNYGNCLPGHAEGDCGQYYEETNNKLWCKCCYPAQNLEVQEERKCKMSVLLWHDNARLHARLANKRSHLQNSVILHFSIHTAQIWPPSDFYWSVTMKNANRE
jgi:hypothetical protein